MSASSRDQILSRIRTANRAAHAGAPPAVPGPAEGQARAGADLGAGPSAAADVAYAALARDYLRAHHDAGTHDITALFAERVADYRAVVERVPESALPAAVARVLTARAAAAPAPSSPAPSSPAPSSPAPSSPAPSAAAPAAGPAATFVVPDGLPDGWLAELPAGITLARDEPPLSPAGLDQLAGVVTGCAVAIAETGTIIMDHGPAQGRRALTLVPDFHLVVVQSGQVAADLADAFARLDPARPHTLISGPSATSDIELIRVEGVHGPRNLHVLITEA
jgi:L-lactate dehydrogenase complex protein LldG